MAIIGMVHAVHEMRHPARVRLDASELELRMALEYATKDEQPHDVLIATDDREKRVDLWPTRTAVHAFTRCENMETQRHLERNGRLEELIIDRAVIVFLDRKAGHHHPA